jgi:hypothetical protein
MLITLQRRERVVFDGIYRKLERELEEKKKQMSQIIDISNAAYEQRDSAQAEMVALKSQSDKASECFTHRMHTHSHTHTHTHTHTRMHTYAHTCTYICSQQKHVTLIFVYRSKQTLSWSGRSSVS